MNQQTLTPVSFHLRNFNNYTTLDLPASQNGNLTLIGENAAGKTTLANCFFPMLIDGSIATPSFNPAKGTDKLDKTSTRNSANDTRNFEGMLLGWGSGAMKVRTGYSYMLMQSNKRQIIVGIGAHRAVGENRKPTWWFVAITEDLSNQLTIEVTDINNQSLEKDAFIAANKNLNGEFKVFSQVGEFQNYVSEKVYGFTNPKSLNQLAITYRLLASPILTAGNARLTPILEAMKNAQEGIDNQIIDLVANTQREVNRKKAVSERLLRAENKLTRLKKEIFWRNLNRLQEKTLDPYGKNYQNLSKQRIIREEEQHKLSEYIRQLETVEPLLKQAEVQISELQLKVAKQESIKELRHGKQNDIDSINKDLNNYQNLKQQYSQQQAELTSGQEDLTQLNGNKSEIEQKIEPLKNNLANLLYLSELHKELEEENLSKMIKAVDQYLLKIKGLKKDYENIIKSQEHLSEDIQIMTEVREHMDDKIDARTNGPVIGRIRPGLHQDNLEVHNAGATKMNLRYAKLEQKRVDLLNEHPDLQKFLDNESLRQQIKAIIEQLKKMVVELSELQTKIDKKEDRLSYIQKDIDKVLQTLQSDFDKFDVDEKKDEIARLQGEIDSLIIDPDLDQKIDAAKSDFNKYQETERDLNNKKTATQTNIENSLKIIEEIENQLKELSESAEANLKILAPYMLDKKLEKVPETMKFLSSNRNKIRTHSFSELSERIGNIMRNNSDGENGLDPYALDNIFEERGHNDIASAMRKQRSIDKGDLRIVNFDINHAQKLILSDKKSVEKSLEQLNSGNELAQTTYIEAAAHQISDQYDLIDGYNRMLAHGVRKSQGIQLKVSLKPIGVDEKVIEEARDDTLTERSALLKEVQQRLDRLANDVKVADDDEQFMEEAHELLDIRQWSDFQIWIHRKQAEIGEFELVDDKFVQSGGSGAEKAQAMVLPLLLVPKMVLNRSRKTDSPHMVMFDEFADKLDPETAKSFAKTIDHFGFNFIATMPSGAQNKVLADGVENVAYDVIAPSKKNDGKFHKNVVRKAMIW